MKKQHGWTSCVFKIRRLSRKLESKQLLSLLSFFFKGEIFSLLCLLVIVFPSGLWELRFRRKRRWKVDKTASENHSNTSVYLFAQLRFSNRVNNKKHIQKESKIKAPPYRNDLKSSLQEMYYLYSYILKGTYHILCFVGLEKERKKLVQHFYSFSVLLYVKDNKKRIRTMMSMMERMVCILVDLMLSAAVKFWR